MQLDTSYQAWLLYKIPDEPSEGSYHYSKAVCLIFDDKVIQEKDIYRRQLDDTTLMQMEIDVIYDLSSDSINAKANFGKIDKRTFVTNLDNVNQTEQNENDLQSFIENSVKRATENYLKQKQCPRYKWEVLSLDQIDIVLNSWTLSRFDNQ